LLSSERGFTFGDETILKKLQRDELTFACTCEDRRLPWNNYNLGVAAGSAAQDELARFRALG
jgi:hypothetical protein